MDDLLATAARLNKQKSTGQMDIFDVLGEPEPEVQLPQIESMAWSQQLRGEREALGIYLSGHPLDAYTELLDRLQVTAIPALEEVKEGSSVTVAGMVAAFKTTLTRKGKRMGFLTLEDQYSTLEIIIFDEVLAAAGDLLAGDEPLLVTGILEFATQDEPKLRAETIARLEAPKAPQKLYLKVCSGTDSDCINRVLYALGRCPGETVVYLFFEETRALRLMDKYSVNPDQRLLVQLEEMLGEDCVVLKIKEEESHL